MILSLLGLTTDSQPGVSDARKKAVVKRKSVPHTPASNSGAKKAKSDDEDHHQEVDVKRIKAEPEPSGSGQQAVMGDEGGIGDDSYAGIFFFYFHSFFLFFFPSTLLLMLSLF